MRACRLGQKLQKRKELHDRSIRTFGFAFRVRQPWSLPYQMLRGCLRRVLAYLPRELTLVVRVVLWTFLFLCCVEVRRHSSRLERNVIRLFRLVVGVRSLRAGRYTQTEIL